MIPTMRFGMEKAMKISISTSSIWYHYGDEFHFYEMIRRCGFKYIDYDFYNILGDDDSRYMKDNWQQEADAARNHMEKLGVRAIQSHAPKGEPANPHFTEGILQRTKRALECAQIMGIPNVVYHPGGQMGMTRKEYMKFNVEYMQKLIPAMEKTGVMILLENVGRWDESFYDHDAEEMLELIDAVNHPLYQACLDIGHLSLQDGEQYSTIKQLGSHLKALHVQDNFGSLPVPITNRAWRQDLHLPPLMGRVSFDEVMQGLIEIGFTGAFNVEVESPRWSGDMQFPHCQNPKLQFMPEELTEEFYTITYRILEHVLRTYGVFEE